MNAVPRPTATPPSPHIKQCWRVGFRYDYMHVLHANNATLQAGTMAQECFAAGLLNPLTLHTDPRVQMHCIAM